MAPKIVGKKKDDQFYINRYKKFIKNKRVSEIY